MHDTDRAREALQWVDAGCQRTEWATIGMAAKDAGLDVDDFIAWSRGAANFQSERDCRDAWRSFKPGSVTAATLFAKAREAGWREQTNGRHHEAPKRPQEPRKADPKAERPRFDCAAVWRDSEPATADHPYIARKLGLPDGLRVVPAGSALRINRQSVAGWLAVPLYDGDELASLQFIGPDGGKLTAPGPMRGWFTVGGPIAPGATAYVCEGIGQAWSAHQATQAPAVVAFGLGRMKPTAQALADQGARVVLVADVGTEAKIEEAAKEIGCAWVAPPADLGKNGDLNDLHQRDGLQAVAALLSSAAEPERPSYAELANLDTDPPPPREWAVRDWLPRGTVTSLFGGGGIGKSLFVQQLATCIANGVQVLGQPVTMGPVLAFLCEDDNDEIRRRQAAILAHLGRSPEYSAAGLHIEGRAGLDNVLVTFGPDRKPTPGTFLAVLYRECERIRPVALILDNIAQLFGGLENDRHQVTVFANILTGIARRFDLAALLLGHIAKGPASEYSGSTAWEAAVRTRLWMERRDDGLIELHRRKANYAGQGSMLLEYRHGALAEVNPDDNAAAASLTLAQAERDVLAALDTLTARQVSTSQVPTATTYLPRLAEREKLLGSTTKDNAARALSALIDRGEILVGQPLGWKKADRHQATGLARRATE